MEFYAIPIDKETEKGKFILYRPMLGIAFTGNQAMVNLVQDFAAGKAPDHPEAMEFLSRIGFLVSDPPLPNACSQEFYSTTAVLLMTNQCQLRCIYCYASAGEHTKQELTFELAKPVIDLVAANAQAAGRPKFSVSLHGGGEPTKAWKVIVACVEYARQKPIPADISLTTNGLWSKAQTEWIIKNIDGLSLSIDGGPETQNRQRPTFSGKASAHLAMRSAAALDQVKFPYGIRMTAIAPWTNLPEDVRYLLEHTNAQTIQVEPSFNTSRSGHIQPGSAEAQAYAEAVLQSYDIAEKMNRRFYYAGARLGTVSDSFCSSPFQALIVRPDGWLVACYEVTGKEHPLAELSRLGSVENGEVNFDPSARRRLTSLISERRSGCRDCFCYWSCAGGCYTRSFLPEPGGHQVRGALCDASREITKKLLLNRIAAGDGVWKK